MTAALSWCSYTSSCSHYTPYSCCYTWSYCCCVSSAWYYSSRHCNCASSCCCFTSSCCVACWCPTVAMCSAIFDLPPFTTPHCRSYYTIFPLVLLLLSLHLFSRIPPPLPTVTPPCRPVGVVLSEQTLCGSEGAAALRRKWELTGQTARDRSTLRSSQVLTSTTFPWQQPAIGGMSTHLDFGLSRGRQQFAHLIIHWERVWSVCFALYINWFVCQDATRCCNHCAKYRAGPGWIPRITL